MVNLNILRMMLYMRIGLQRLVQKLWQTLLLVKKDRVRLILLPQHDHLEFKDGHVGLRVAHPNLRQLHIPIISNFTIVGWGERSEAQHDHLKFKDGSVGLRAAHPNLRQLHIPIISNFTIVGWGDPGESRGKPNMIILNLKMALLEVTLSYPHESSS